MWLKVCQDFHQKSWLLRVSTRPAIFHSRLSLAVYSLGQFIYHPHACSSLARLAQPLLFLLQRAPEKQLLPETLQPQLPHAALLEPRWYLLLLFSPAIYPSVPCSWKLSWAAALFFVTFHERRFINTTICITGAHPTPQLRKRSC